MGRRIRKRVETYNGSSWPETSDELFVYDGWNVVLVLNGSNDTVRKYTWGLALDTTRPAPRAGLPDNPQASPAAASQGLDLSGTLHGAGGIGGLLAVDETQGAYQGAYWFFYDGNGNVGQLVKTIKDGQGNITGVESTLAAHYEYDPYGNVINSSGPYKDANPFRFSTKWFDEETGLGYWGYRYYSPRLGRWISRDPIGERGGLNLHAYAANQPIETADFRGLWLIQRSPDAERAQAVAEPNDTVSMLANKIRLQPEEYTLWLRQLPGGVSSIPASVNTPVQAECTFTVPNLAYVVWGWDFDSSEFPNITSTVNTTLGVLRSQKYRVDEVVGAATESVTALQVKLRHKDLAGFVFVGHGTSNGGLATGDPPTPNALMQHVPQNNYRRLGRTYRLAFMYLFSCYSADASAGTPIPPSAWVRNVSSRGVFHGYVGPITDKNYMDPGRTYTSHGFP